MAGGRFRCLSCFFTCSSVLLLRVSLHNVEASGCQLVVHKKVGDAVQLSPCLSTEGVAVATWKYGEFRIADKDERVSKKQFEGRLYLNPTNLTLTVERLTLQDSGNFSFISAEVSGKQRRTDIITLQVHKPITNQPVLTSNCTWHTTNGSCTVSLECSASADSRVSYTWTVRNQTGSGSRLQYVIRPEEGDTEFSCTIHNFVSETSASRTVKCSKETSMQRSPVNVVILRSAVGAACLIFIVGIAVVVCHCRRRQPGGDLNDVSEYADISEVAIQDETSMKPPTVYETIENRVNSVPLETRTVYDEIQLSRMQEACHEI